MRFALTLCTLLCASLPAAAQTLFVRDQNLGSLVGYNLTVDSPNSVGIPTSNCVGSGKVYNLLAIHPTSGQTLALLAESNANLSPGDRYFVKQNSGDEATVSCNGVNFLRLKVSRNYWIRRNAGGAGVPGARSWHSMANNGNGAAGQNRSYVFGGSNMGTYLGDLWHYNADSGAWTQVVTGKTKPSARGHAASSFGLGYLVLHGGVSGAVPTNETWRYNEATNAWSRSPSNCNNSVCPPARWAGSLAYDPSRSYFVLFGGQSGTSGRDDTYTYNGTSWTARAPSVRPSPRRSAGIAYVPSHTALGTAITMNRVVLFGGQTVDVAALGDMWSWNGTNWEQITATNAGPVLHSHGMSWDTTTAGEPRLAIAGGYVDTNDTVSPHTWYFTFTSATQGTWSKETPPTAVAPRAGANMAFDPARKLRVFFGGVSGATFYQDTVVGD